MKKASFENSIRFLAEQILPFLKQPLTEFHIDYPNCIVSQNTYNLLCKSVSKQAENLTKFFFVLESENAKNIPLLELISSKNSLLELFTSMPNLKEFRYQITSKIFNDEVLQGFTSKALSSFKNLESFHLIIPGSDVTDVSVKEFFEKPPQEWFSKLKTFHVDLTGTKITDESFKGSIFKTIRKLQKLTELNICVLDTEVSPLILKTINQAAGFLMNAGIIYSDQNDKEL